jgi:hypothetical protein
MENRSVDDFLCFYIARDKDLRVATASVLNIRLAPNGTIIGTYTNGTTVEVLERVDGWYRTTNGWV